MEQPDFFQTHIDCMFTVYDVSVPYTIGYSDLGLHQVTHITHIVTPFELKT